MAKFFVSLQDKQQSGWGAAKGKKSMVVFECDSPREAGIVMNNGLNRSDFTDVSTVLTVEPTFNTSTHHVTKATKQTWSEFYQR